MKRAAARIAMCLALAVSGCGLRTDDEPVPIPPDQLPTSLPSPTNTVD
jgi:hypothetical protein